jgi:hypothetical protein
MKVWSRELEAESKACCWQTPGRGVVDNPDLTEDDHRYNQAIFSSSIVAVL